MKCEDALLLISGHMDQENTAEEEAQLQLHLENCEACRAVLQAFEEMNGGLIALEEEPPADLHRNVMNMIREESAAPKKRNRRWVGIAVAAAFAVVIGASAMPKFAPAPVETNMPMTARAVPGTMEMLSADTGVSAQDIANEKQAVVAVTYEVYSELEDCECETLEDGAILYCLNDADAAEAISKQYHLDLFLPPQVSSDVSYALLLPLQ